MNQKEMVEKMFENLHNVIGENVCVLTWWNNHLIKVEGLLKEVTDYEKICVNNVYYPFIDYAKAIFYVKCNDNVIYLNPTVKDGFEVKPYYYVEEMKNKFYGENNNLTR